MSHEEICYNLTMALLILAAGFATRLEPRTLTIPKQLLEIKKDYYLMDIFWKSISRYCSIRQLAERTILVTNDKYFPEFQKWVKKRGLDIEILNDGVKSKEEKIGAVGDFLFGVDRAKITDDVFVCASDFILPEMDFDRFITMSKEYNASAIITVIENSEDQLKAGSCVKINQDHQVVRFQEKPKELFSNLYGVPYYIFKAQDIDIIRRIPKEERDNSGQMAAKLVKESKLYAVEYDGKVIHITTEEDYQELIKQYQLLPA